MRDKILPMEVDRLHFSTEKSIRQYLFTIFVILSRLVFQHI